MANHWTLLRWNVSSRWHHLFPCADVAELFGVFKVAKEMRFMRNAIVVAVVFCLSWAVDVFAEASLDCVPFGYVFIADRPAKENPPETHWITGDLHDVIAGVMWEEHRPVREIEVAFSGPAPDPSQLVVEVTTNTPNAGQENRPTWWTRAWEAFPGRAVKSADGRRITFQTDRAAIVERLKHYPADFQHEADPKGLLLVDKIRLRYRGGGKPAAVASLRAIGVATLTPMHVEIEWGCLPGQERQAFDGQLEVYNGRSVAIAPLPESGVIVAAEKHWQSAPVAKGRRGINAEILYVADDGQEVRFHKLDREDSMPNGTNGASISYRPDRTVVTVRTSGGSFSFAPKDLDSGEPIFVPSLGFFICKSNSGQSAAQFVRQLAEKKLLTTRQRVRQIPEQSIAKALSAQYTASRPAFPRPPEEPLMKIDVPDELASNAWRLAYWHVKRRCILKDGVYQIYIWPYQSLLGQESWRIFVALDWLGEHAIPQSGFTPWFQSQGRFVARGMFSSKLGAFNVDGWDINHGQGHGSMLYALGQHYLLSGDKAWLKEHLASIKAGAEWVVAERKQWIDKVGPDAWSSGLIPPCELGDYADWRSLYQTNTFYWRGLKCVALAIADADAEAGKRLLDEAEQYRRSILRAVDRSAVLSPVVRVGDGTYRRYIPPQPYLRGMAREIVNPFGTGHAGPNWLDSDGGAVALALGVLPTDDPRLDETLDVVEDVAYRDNWVIRTHTSQRQPNNPEAWFTIGGYYYQCGYSQTAMAYLMRDDAPNYLRSMFNQYAVDIDPAKAYVFREHPNRAGDGGGGDKTFEVAAFLERMRAMFVFEDGDRFWLAKATPRAWLEQGKKIAVANAPTQFGTTAYEIVSDVDHGKITATIEMPSRRPAKSVFLRLRHPKALPIQSVTVNGEPWTDFNSEKEIVTLPRSTGKVVVVASY